MEKIQGDNTWINHKIALMTERKNDRRTCWVVKSQDNFQGETPAPPLPSGTYHPVKRVTAGFHHQPQQVIVESSFERKAVLLLSISLAQPHHEKNEGTPY